jgi:hypothetical protein
MLENKGMFMKSSDTEKMHRGKTNTAFNPHGYPFARHKRNNCNKMLEISDSNADNSHHCHFNWMRIEKCCCPTEYKTTDYKPFHPEDFTLSPKHEEC